MAILSEKGGEDGMKDLEVLVDMKIAYLEELQLRLEEGLKRSQDYLRTWLPCCEKTHVEDVCEESAILALTCVEERGCPEDVARANHEDAELVYCEWRLKEVVIEIKHFKKLKESWK